MYARRPILIRALHGLALAGGGVGGGAQRARMVGGPRRDLLRFIRRPLKL